MLPNKMTPAVSSRLIRWALWASRHHHASRTEGLAGRWSSAGLTMKLYGFFFLLFVCRQPTESRSGGVSRSEEDTVWVRKCEVWLCTAPHRCLIGASTLKKARTGGKRVFVSRAVRVLDYSSKKLVMTILVWHIGNYWSIPAFTERFIYFWRTPKIDEESFTPNSTKAV